MKHPLLITALAMANLGLIAFVQTGALRGCPVRNTDHAAILSSNSGVSPQQKIKVLFIGNSLTFVNDLPAMLVHVASSDAANTTELDVQASTIGNATLKQLLDDGCALDLARSKRFDDVVLQEHSFFWADPVSFNEAKTTVATMATAIRKYGGTPVMFQIWGNGQGGDANITTTANLENITEGVAELSAPSSLPVVRVGEAFADVDRMGGAPDLYQADHHHPSVAGTYLAALVFYQFFAARPAAGVVYRPPELTDADAATLRQVADRH
jgi:lysophospholipase L1-like esterase